MLEIEVGGARFEARLEEGGAPKTVAAFRRLLPLESKLIHARWSGEACWIPFGELDVGVDSENATAYPAPGELLLYPGGVSHCPEELSSVEDIELAVDVLTAALAQLSQPDTSGSDPRRSASDGR